MNTVPVTKLKGDLMLELKDIRLEINKEKSALEEILSEKNKINLALSNGEFKIREEALKRIDDKYGKEIDKKEEILADVDKNINAKNRQISNLNNELKILEINAKIIKDKFDAYLEGVKKETLAKKREIESLDERIAKLDCALSDLIGKEIKLNEKIKVETDIISESKTNILNREKLVEEKEKKVESAKMDLRIWSVRLNKKYGKFMSEAEKKLTAEQI